VDAKNTSIGHQIIKLLQFDYSSFSVSQFCAEYVLLRFRLVKEVVDNFIRFPDC
jgi:hypothetical protein